MKIINEGSILCENCLLPHNKIYGSGRFCSSKCARQYASKNNRPIINQKIADALKRIKSKLIPCKKCGKLIETKYTGSNILCDNCKASNSLKKYCQYCGNKKKECLRPDICKKHQLFPTLIKYFGFDSSVIGTNNIIKEFERIKNIVHEDYWDKKCSLIEMQVKYNHKNNGNFLKILKGLGIELRTRSQGMLTGYEMNRVHIALNPKYKYGWHLTWNNKKIFYRSSYELDYAKILDANKIDYEVESLRILYFDTQLQRQRTAIPDFYLPCSNEIIEIKSNYTFNEQNLKDKFKAYKEHGYKPKIILEHKEFIPYW